MMQADAVAPMMQPAAAAVSSIPILPPMSSSHDHHPSAAASTHAHQRTSHRIFNSDTSSASEEESEEMEPRTQPRRKKKSQSSRPKKKANRTVIGPLTLTITTGSSLPSPAGPSSSAMLSQQIASSVRSSYPLLPRPSALPVDVRLSAQPAQHSFATAHASAAPVPSVYFAVQSSSSSSSLMTSGVGSRATRNRLGTPHASHTSFSSPPLHARPLTRSAAAVAAEREQKIDCDMNEVKADSPTPADSRRFSCRPVATVGYRCDRPSRSADSHECDEACTAGNCKVKKAQSVWNQIYGNVNISEYTAMDPATMSGSICPLPDTPEEAKLTPSPSPPPEDVQPCNPPLKDQFDIRHARQVMQLPPVHPIEYYLALQAQGKSKHLQKDIPLKVSERVK